MQILKSQFKSQAVALYLWNSQPEKNKSATSNMVRI